MEPELDSSVVVEALVRFVTLVSVTVLVSVFVEVDPSENVVLVVVIVVFSTQFY